MYLFLSYISHLQLDIGLLLKLSGEIDYSTRHTYNFIGRQNSFFLVGFIDTVTEYSSFTFSKYILDTKEKPYIEPTHKQQYKNVNTEVTFTSRFAPQVNNIKSVYVQQN